MWIRMTKQKELRIVVKAGRSASERDEDQGDHSFCSCAVQQPLHCTCDTIKCGQWKCVAMLQLPNSDLNVERGALIFFRPFPQEDKGKIAKYVDFSAVL